MREVGDTSPHHRYTGPGLRAGGSSLVACAWHRVVPHKYGSKDGCCMGEGEPGQCRGLPVGQPTTQEPVRWRNVQHRDFFSLF